MASSSSLHRFDLCSIGNVCIDLIDTVDDAFLMRHGLRKSFCVSLTDVQLSALIKDLPSPIRTPGGVGANVAHVVQALGGHACFQGRRGDDNEGKIFADDLARHGIEQHLPQSEGQKSSIVACLSTLDGDRTFGTFDGAGKMLSPSDLDLPLITASRIFYFDCYTMISFQAPDVFHAGDMAAKAAGGMSCLNPCDLSLIESHPLVLRKMAAEADILICNHAEASALYGKTTLDETARLASMAHKAGAVTDGENGAIAFLDGKTIFVPPADVSSLSKIHSNGAGDHFAGGFLYAIARGMSLRQAGELGRLCSADCLAHPEARPLHSLQHLVGEAAKI